MDQQLMKNEQTKVLVEEIPLKGGVLGKLTFNQESTLNSLNLEMVDSLLEWLEKWRNDERVRLIFIDSSSEKAFCAGGDVQALYESATENPGGPCKYAETFFCNEYLMNYTLHTYPKPVICWGHGIVMGGGLGVLAACSHRIVTETTRIAMPEITIALFPDVGGSWFLNKMPEGVGRFLALTGASINANDAIFTNIADRILSSDSKEAFLQMLRRESWSEENDTNSDLLSGLIDKFASAQKLNLKNGQIQSRLELIRKLGNDKDLQSTVQSITGLDDSDQWLGRAREGLLHGSPFAACWIDRQLKISKEMTLESIFQSEILLVTNIIRDPEFSEGVRALLIDKDKNPAWQFPDVASVPQERLDQMFKPPWPKNPLANLAAPTN